MANDPIPKENQNVTTLSNRPALDAELEAELAQIRRAPAAAVGMGEKAYSPYELVEGEDLVRATEPEVVPRLAAEALDPRNDRVFRFVMLQILGLRREAAVDAALVNELADPLLRPLAAYFLGRPGYKGYPARDRNTVTPILRALAAYLQDAGVYQDPWYHNTRATADLALAAFVRIAGPQAFTFANPRSATSSATRCASPMASAPGCSSKRSAGRWASSRIAAARSPSDVALADRSSAPRCAVFHRLP